MTHQSYISSCLLILITFHDFFLGCVHIRHVHLPEESDEGAGESVEESKCETPANEFFVETIRWDESHQR
jgi:hypothetical protein